MRAVWGWGRRRRLLPQKVTDEWPAEDLMLDEPRGRVRFLSDSEIAALLKAAESDQVMRAAIKVSILTGLRQGELLRLTWGDVALEKRTVTVHESKNNERRAVYLSEEAVDALKALPVRGIGAKPVFVLDDSTTPLKKSLLEMRWNKIRTAAKLKDFRWHDLRHSCASLLAQGGASLLQIGSVLGHKSPSVTLRYAHLVAGAPVTGHDKLDAKLRGK
jgi:integrase